MTIANTILMHLKSTNYFGRLVPAVFSSYTLLAARAFKKPAAQPLQQVQAASLHLPLVVVHVVAVAPAADTLRIGDYTVGQGDCPDLYGYPDIRY